MPSSSRPSLAQRLSSLPSRLPPRAREAASAGFRLLVGLAWCGATVALLVAFATLHLRLETGRRAAGELAEGLLDDALRGRIEIGHVEVLSPWRLVVRDVVVLDPTSRPVIVVDRLAADVDPWRILRGEIRIERIGVRRPRVALWPGDREYVSLLDAFEPNYPPDPGAVTPDVRLQSIHVANGTVVGVLPGVFDIDAHRISAGASLRVVDRAPFLDVRWANAEVRRPVPVAVAGRVHLDGASEHGPAGVHGNARTRWGRSDVYTAFGVSPERIRVHVSTEGVQPEDLRAIGIPYPLGGLIRGRVAVDGPPALLRATALLRVESGRLRAGGTFAFGPPARYALDLAAEGIDLARLVPGSRIPSTLGIAGRIEGSGVTRGTLDARFVGRLAPGVVDGTPLPGGELETRLDSEGVTIARFVPEARGLAGVVRGRVTYEGAVDARGEVHARRLALVHGLRRVGGSGSARFRFRRETTGALDVELTGAGRGIEFGPARFADMDVSARAHVEWPAIDGHLDVQGAGVEFAGAMLGATTLSARGDHRIVRIVLSSVDPERRQSRIEATIRPDPEGFTAQVTQAEAGFVGEPLRGSLKRLDYRRNRVEIEELVLVRGDARLTANGTYDLSGRARGVVTANNLDLAEAKRFLGEEGRAIEGRMGIRLEIDGPIRRPDFVLSAEIRGARYGNFGPADLVLAADGRNGRLGIDTGLALSGSEVLHVAGETPLDLGATGLGRVLGRGERNLEIEMTALDLDRFAPLLYTPGETRPGTGVLTGTVGLRGTWADPTMDVNLRADRGRVGVIEDVTATLAAHHESGRTAFRLDADRAGAQTLDAQGSYDARLGITPDRPLPTAQSLWDAPMDVRVAVGPIDWSSLPTQLHLDPMIDARVVLAGHVTGSASLPSFEGEADVRDVGGEALPWDGGLGGHFEVRYDRARFETEGHLADGESIVARVRSGVALDLVEAIREGPRLGDWNVEASFEDVPIHRVRWFAGKPVVGKVRGSVSIAVAEGNATLRGEIEAQELRIGEEPIPEFVARMDYSGQLLTVSARAKQRAGGEIEGRATWRLPWQGGVGTTATDMGWPMSGDLSARAFRISSLLPSIPEVAAMDGQLDGAVSLVRFEDSPQVNGRLAVTRGVFEVAGFGQRFTDIETRVTLSGSRFTIETLSLRDRTGTVRAVRAGDSPPGEGTLRDLIPETFRLHLDASRFPIVREGAPLARVSGRIDVSGRVEGKTITMDAKLRGARVDLPARATRDLQSLADHPDIVIVTRQTASELEGEPIVFVVRIDLRDEMWLVRDDMRIAFVGRVNLWYAWAGDLLLEGTIELSRGEAEAYGRRFRIDTGFVTFEAVPGKLDPLLDVRAIWENPEHLVLLRVSGRLSRPRISFGSDPADLSQDQIMTLLVLGRTEARETNEQQTVDETAERQTAALLQGIGVALAQQSVHESLPDIIPIVAIEPGEEGFSDARYRAGRQFGRFYSEVAYSSTEAPRPGQNRWETRIEYRISRRWSVESHAGDENQGADLLWSYSY